MTSPPPLILHIFPSFAVGGAQIRMATLANHFGQQFRHIIIALDQQITCQSHLDPRLDVQFLPAPPSTGTLPQRLAGIRATLRAIAPDLLITSNWGAMEWAIARFGAGIHRHIHTEDGFGPQEHQTQLRRRILIRRTALRWSDLVVPSATLNRIARDIWRLPAHRRHFIPNGVDLARFHPDPNPPAPTRTGLTILCVAALRPEKNLSRLLRALALADLTPPPRLRIAGDGPDRATLEQLAQILSLNVEFLGTIADPAAFYRAADLFALSSDTEQMPLSVIEAMSSGLPVIATDVGDIAAMLAPENHILLTARSDQALAYAFKTTQIIDRRSIGAANRRKAELLFDITLMTDHWQALLDPPAQPRKIKPNRAPPE